jgi:tRNA modification GTPase
MKIRANDTIAAIATPPGEGAIAIIRLSGEDAAAIADRVFVGKRRLAEVEGNTVHFGKLKDANGTLVDEVLATVFRAPHSYTGEDSIEINCHGGILVASRVLDTVIATGARRADPGEFTKRAFLNGKIDLSQAEAVADLIAARSRKAHLTSLGQLQGRLAAKVAELKSDLVHLCSLLELELDFSDEGIPLVSRHDLVQKIQNVQSTLEEMIGSYDIGKVYRDGVSVVLVGKPNAGKSSLFNALLREDRAIVHHSPGTTRDFIEEAVVLNGVLFRLFDTAGLRRTNQEVEAQGVETSRSLINQADIVLVVVDSSVPGDRRDPLSPLDGIVPAGRTVIAYNKIDLLPGQKSRLDRSLVNGTEMAEVYLSAKTGDGIAILADILPSGIPGLELGSETSIVVTSKRHKEVLLRVKQSLLTARRSIDDGLTNEFVALDMRQAIDALSEITGEITTEDMLNQIFSRFCIGK